MVGRINQKLAAWAGKRAVEGVANEMFMSRLGEAVRRVCRLIPVTGEVMKQRSIKSLRQIFMMGRLRCVGPKRAI